MRQRNPATSKQQSKLLHAILTQPDERSESNPASEAQRPSAANQAQRIQSSAAYQPIAPHQIQTAKTTSCSTASNRN